MASVDKNFIVKTGLSVGPTVISATTGDITVGNTVINGTTGNITIGATTIDGATGAISTTANVSTTGSFVVGATVLGSSSSSFDGATVVNSTINSTPIGATTAAVGNFTTIDATGTVTTNDILPHVTNVSNIGSATHRFNTIFVNEARLSTNTLYLGDTPILGTTGTVVNVHTDAGQSLSLQTSGAAGAMSFAANAAMSLQTIGNNADITIQSNGTGSKTKVLSATTIEVTAPTITATGAVGVTGGLTVSADSTFSNNLVVQGNLTVSGTSTTVNTTDMNVKDNIVVVNSGETGLGVSAGTAGIQFARGQLGSYQLVFKESDQSLQFGPIGSTTAMADKSWVTTNYLGSASASTVAGTANRIVKADVSGYIANTYFSSSDNSAASGVTAVMVKAGDNYLRSGTAAAVATFLSGQTMNIAGSSSSCTGNAVTATTATNLLGSASTYTHIGAWGQAGGAANTFLVNRAYRSDTCDGNSATATSATTAATANALNTANAYTVAGLTTTGTITVGNSTNSSIYMSDTDEGQRQIHCNSNYIGFLTQAGNWGAYCDDSGNWAAAGNVTAYSDERLKTNWRDLPSNLVAQLADVKVGVYDRTDANMTQVGVSAQSLQQIMPEAVQEDKDGMLSVSYGNAALAACIALAKEVQSLKAEIAALKAK